MVQDIMRETCLTDLAGIWYNLVATYSESNPDLAESVLAAVRRYVSWIDIGLVANDRCSASRSASQCACKSTFKLVCNETRCLSICHQ